jgi:hypothetical protein
MSDQRIDSGELRNPKTKAGKAKKAARGVYDASINLGVSQCDDTPAFRRWVADARADAMNHYRAHRDPNLDNVRRVVNPRTGREHWELLGCRLPARSVRRILAAEDDFEKNENYLESWFPFREEFARAKHRGEKLRGEHGLQEPIQPLLQPVAQPLAWLSPLVNPEKSGPRKPKIAETK